MDEASRAHPKPYALDRWTSMRVTVGLLIVGVLSCLVLLVDGIARSAAGESAAAAIALAALLVAVANDIRRFRGARTGRGLRVVAIGGGTGLPVSLRAAKIHTSNITAIVTVADDGGSSGRLRREMRVAPPGDLRNNIAALADDESLMTRLLQYRFSGGELRGHAFGNLFIAALADITGSLDQALTEVARVLNLRGRVLPTTLDDVKLVATVLQPDRDVTIRVEGESQIPETGGRIQSVTIEPETVRAFPDSVAAILNAQVVLIGPGSLYTSILPSLLVPGILDALRASAAIKVYVCNVAEQPGETTGYTVADHILALERHIGRGVFQVVVSNGHFPTENAGPNTVYVKPPQPHHEVRQRYDIRSYDLTDNQRPWRHDALKLSNVIRELVDADRSGDTAG